MQKNFLKIGGGIFLLLLAVGIFYFQVNSANADKIENWGIADAKEINVNSKVSGRILEIFVEEGDAVKKNQIIAKIDKDFQEPQKKSAEAAINAQIFQLQQILISSRETAGTLDANLQNANAKLFQAETNLNLAEKNELRYRELLQENAISQQTYDIYKTQLESSQADFSAAKANLENAKISLLKNDENIQQQKILEEQIKNLQSQLESVELNIKETEIFAPFDGIITKKFVEEGQIISNVVPLFSLQDPTDNWIDFKIKETELQNFKIGEEIYLIGRDENLKILGKIESIRRKADFATQKATSERGETDIISFNLKIRTDNEKIFPGMRFKIYE